jgi:integrase
MTTARIVRKSIRTLGQKRRGDYVRVLQDVKRQRYEVLYADASGVKSKRVFPLSRDGKGDAIKFAEAFHDERKRIAAGDDRRVIPATAVHGLWRAFVEAPAYGDLRAKSQINYAERWRKWETYIGRNTVAATTTLHDVDQFIARARTAGMAINQIRQVLNVARIVYNWGQTRKLIAQNELALHRWKRPKDAVVNNPEEYSDEEYSQLLRALNPQDTRDWRIWVALMLAGHQGQRANAVLHLRWADVDETDGVILWPAEYQKNGEVLTQPLTWEAVAALETARYWLQVPTGRAFTRMNRHQRIAADEMSRSPWVIPGHGNHAGKPYGYQAMWRALRALEERAGVGHRPYRALHGFRKMVAGNVADRTGDDRLGMEWIGDKDMKQARSYLKQRKERMEKAAGVVGGDR